MIFTEIEKKSIVKNKIEIEDNIKYIYSSGEDDGFNHKNRTALDLEKNESGIHGALNVSGFFSEKIKYIDDRYYSHLNNINVGKLYMASNSSFDLLPKGQKKEVVKEVTLTNQNGFTDEEINTFGEKITVSAHNNKNSNYKFKIDRITKKYLTRDLNAEKISAVKRIHDYYNKRYSEKNNYKKFKEGFYNYNTINFYTMGNISKEHSANYMNYISNEESKTHKNCLIYPNIYNEEKHQYDFNSIEEKSFSFFVNLNKKNKVREDGTILAYNAGCLMFIPGVLSINVIKGSSIDGNGMNDMFRIFCQFGEYSYENVSYEDAGDDSNVVLDGSNFLKSLASADNVLKYNNWHNINLSLKKIKDNIYNIELYVDGNLIDSYSSRINFLDSNENSYITIGNKPFLQTNNDYSLQDLNRNLTYKYFSENKQIENDHLGPYCKNFIDYGVNIQSDKFITSIQNSVANDKILFKDDLYIDNRALESFAFHGEIHDIRIYDESLSEDISKEIFNSSVNKENSLDLKNLIFYVPVFYSSKIVKKEGYVNLHNNVSKKNIAYDFPTNPYFFNFCGGHELSVENFLEEFVKKTNPHVLLDEKENNCLQFLESEEIKIYSQIGEDPLIGVIKKIYEGESIFNLSKDLLYRNNFILPNDNGIQKQNFQYVYENFQISMFDSHLFKVNNDYYNYSFVCTSDYVNNDLYQTSMIKENFNNQNLLMREQNTFLNDLFVYKTKNISAESALSFIQRDGSQSHIDVTESYLQEDSFQRRIDILWNISNKNFHSIYYVNDSENLGGYDNALTLSPVNTESNYMTYSIMYDKRVNQEIANTISNYIIENPGSISSVEISQSFLNKTIFNTSNVTLSIGENEKYNTYSNPSSRLLDAEIVSYNEADKLISIKDLKNNENIQYFSYDMPLYITNYDSSNYNDILFSISSQFINKGIKNQTVTLSDVDLMGSGGSLSIKLNDNKFGQLYRADCLTQKAKWACIGNCLYSEGFLIIGHPGIKNFGYSNFKIEFETSTNLYTHELNLPAYSGKFNVSSNNSYIEDLRMDNTSFNLDEDFVYITDINIHDENLNILAKARLANPFAKKNSDNVLFRLKMDY
jgi:hypothetical protein